MSASEYKCIDFVVGCTKCRPGVLGLSVYYDHFVYMANVNITTRHIKSSPARALIHSPLCLLLIMGISAGSRILCDTQFYLFILLTFRFLVPVLTSRHA